MAEEHKSNFRDHARTVVEKVFHPSTSGSYKETVQEMAATRVITADLNKMFAKPERTVDTAAAREAAWSAVSSGVQTQQRQDRVASQQLSLRV